MATPTQEELDSRLDQLSQRALELGATPDEVNSILSRVGMTTELPSIQPKTIQGGFANDLPVGFASEYMPGFSNYQDTSATKKQNLEQRAVNKIQKVSEKSDPVFSDFEMLETSGKLGNLGLAAYVGSQASAAKFLGALPALVRKNQLQNVTTDDFVNYASAKQKIAKREALTKQFDLVRSREASPERDARLAELNRQLVLTEPTDAEKKVFEGEIIPAPKGLPNAKERRGKSPAERIEKAEEASQWIQTLDNVVARTRELVNTSISEPAERKLHNQNQRAVAKFQEGEYLEGIGEFGEGILNLITEDTYAASQVFSESLPYMLSMLVAGSVTIPTEAVSLNHQSTNDFIDQFGELPTEEEQDLIQVLSIAGALTDKVSANVTGSMATQVKSLLKASNRLNKRVPKKLIQGLTTVGSPVAAAITEGTTEGVQSVLQQTAATVRDVDIDPVQALSEAAHGAFGGVAFSSPNVARDLIKAGGKTTKVALDAAAKGIEKASKKSEEQITKETEEILSDTSATKESIDKIIADGIGSLPTEQRVARLKKLIETNAEYKESTPEGEEVDTSYDSTIHELIAFHKELVKKETEGKTTQEQIKTLVPEGQTETEDQKAESNKAIKSIVKEIKEGTQIPLASVDKVFGSTAFARASDSDKKVINEYVEYIKSFKEVKEDIQKGKDNFVGLETHLKNLTSSVSIGDKEGSQKTIDELDNFAFSHREKIKVFKSNLAKAKKNKSDIKFKFRDREYVANLSGSTARFIKTLESELKSIETTLDRAKGIFTESFKEAPQEVTPEPITTELIEDVEPTPEKEVKQKVEDTKEDFTSNIQKDFINRLNTLGSTPEEVAIRDDFIKKVKQAKTVKEVSSLRKDINKFQKELGTGKSTGTAATVDREPVQSLSERLISSPSEDPTSTAGLLVQKVKKGVTKSIGTPAGFTVKDIFKLKSNIPDKVLNTIPNFFSSYLNKTLSSDVTADLKQEEINLLDSIAGFNKVFSESVTRITSFTAGSPAYPESSKALSSLDQNPLGYLVKVGPNGTRYLDENLMGIMGTVAYNWLATRASKTLINLDQDINSILGRDSNTTVSWQESNQFRFVGTTQTNLAESLGKEVTKQLGLEVTNKVDGNMLDRLGMSIGLTIVSSLADQGFIQQNKVSAEIMKSFRLDANQEQSNFDSKLPTLFIKLKGNPTNKFKPTDKVQEFVDLNKEAKDFINNTFGVSSYERYVSTSPIKSTPKTLKDTTQKVPKRIKDAIKKAQSVEWEIKENTNSVVNQISRDTLLKLAGVVDVSNIRVHKRREDSIVSKNTAITRDIDNFFKSRDVLNNSGFFLEYEVWKNMRMGVTTNMLNPQASKVIRHLVGIKSWNIDVPITGEVRTNFKLAVAQSFGFDIDKKNPKKSVDFFQELIKNETVIKGLDALKDLSKEGAEQALIEAVEYGGENLHTLDGLIALSNYSPNKVFSTNLALETDGVTNGVAIGLLQAPLETGIKNILKSVGIFFNSTSTDNYPSWADNPTHYDLYQRLGIAWNKELSKFRTGGPSTLNNKIDSLERIIGVLATGDEITDLGRKLSKDPLMLTNYGAAISGVVSELNNKFLEAIYKKLETAKTPREVKEIVQDVYNAIGIPVPTDINYKDPLSINFDGIIPELNNVIEQTYGVALKAALESQFKNFFKFRESVNNALNVMFLTFNYYYEQDIKQAEEAKGLRLSPDELKAIYKKNSVYLPTFLSPTSTDLSDSVLAIKTTKETDYSDSKSKVQLTLTNSPFDAGSVSGRVSKSKYLNPGVSGLVLGTHAQDAATQAGIMLEYDMLNVHDAGMYSIADTNAGTKKANETFWKVQKGYSLVKEVLINYERIRNLSKNDKDLTAVINKELPKTIFADPELVSLATVGNRLSSISDQVAKARKDIFDTDTNIGVNQFAHVAESVYTANQTLENLTVGELINTITLGIDLDLSQEEALPGKLKLSSKEEQEQYNRIRSILDSLKDKKSFGSSIEEVNFDTFNSNYDELLTANNSLQIFEDMENFGNKVENKQHKAHLKEVLTNVVNKVLTAKDSILYRVGETDKPTHGATKGERVYINSSVANRLTQSDMSVQEVQVHELLHAVLSYGIDSNFNIRQELKKLFNQVDAAIKEQYGNQGWKIFMPKTVLTNRAEEVKAAKARYNYIFNNDKLTTKESIDSNSGLRIESKTNDYLHEFVSFGLTNEKFIEVLSTIKSKRKRETQGLTFFEKLKALYLNLLDWVSGKIYGTSDVDADVALRNLVDKLTWVTNKQRNQALQHLTGIRSLNDKASKVLEKRILEPFVEWRQREVATPVRIPGKILNLAAVIPITARSKEFRKRIKQVFRRLGLTEESFLVKLVRELQGTKSSNIRWHTLLRHSKHLIDSARKQLAGQITEEIRANFVTDLPDADESKALTRAFMEIDLGVLLASKKASDGESYTGKYSVERVLQIMRNRDELSKEITATLKELDVFRESNYYRNQAKSLGHIMAQSVATIDNPMLNAYNIANLTTTQRVPSGDVVKAEEIIDRLSTLYGILYSEKDALLLAANVMQREFEANADENGISYLINLLEFFKEDSLNQLFNGNKTAMIKGYIHETFNPNVAIKFGTDSDKEAMAFAGYTQFSPLDKDRHDPNTTATYMYVNKNNVNDVYLKSIVSLTNKTAKGSTLLDGYQNTSQGVPTEESKEALAIVSLRKAASVDKQFTNASVAPNEEPTLVPILNERGEISGYRYLMSNHLKATLLERDDRFDLVAGRMFGSIKDKVNSKQVNRQVIELAYEDYQEGFSEDPEAYVRIALDSPEERYRELYSMLPEDARRDMKEVWGKKEIYIKRELSDLIFGYRKWSIGQMFQNKDFANINAARENQLQAESMKAINKVLQHGITRHTEAIWQQVVGVAKTNIVIRNPVVLIGNFISNLALSWVKGVPITYMIKHQALALRALNEYQETLKKRDSLQRRLDITPNLTKSEQQSLRNQIARLSDDLTNNPVKDLIDEGIFQSIVEDVEDTDSPYSYKDSFLHKVKLDKFLESTAAKPAKAIGEQLYLADNTTVFKLLLKGTQYSDFIARFAMHKYNTEVKDMDKESSIKDVVETFINYDIPTSKAMQYMNDMGFFMFSKFLFRIQKVILSTIAKRPASTASLLLLQNVFGDFSDIVDANLITGSLAGRAGFIAGPLDSATELSGANIVMDVLGY